MKTTISDRYEVDLNSKDDVIGEGSQAIVYRGYDRILKLDVAVKIYRLVNYNENIKSLQQEYNQIEKFYHPNVINYYDWAVFTHQKKILFAFIMNFADLGTLDSYKANLKEQNLQRANEVFVGILNGLKHIHSMGIVHRDLKPSNILLSSEDGKRINPIISDFLFESIVSPNEEQIVTAIFKGTFGTIEYMAPELLGTKNVFIGHSTDLWSFGVMVYEFFMGELPFGSRGKHNDPIKVAESILTQEVDCSDIPEPYNFVVEACLAKDMSKRISDAQILIDLISKYKIEERSAKNIASKSKKHTQTLPTQIVERNENDRITGFINITELENNLLGPRTIRFSTPSPVFKGTLTGNKTRYDTRTIIFDRTLKEGKSIVGGETILAGGKVNNALLDEIQKLKERIEELERAKEKTSKKSIFSKNVFQDLIAQNEISKCFVELNKLRDRFSHELNKTYIMIQAEWSKLKMQEMHGIIEQSILMVNSNKVRYKLLEFIDLLEIGD